MFYKLLIKTPTVAVAVILIVLSFDYLLLVRTPTVGDDW